MKTLTLLLAFLLAPAAFAQECAFNTGNNASIFVMKDAYRSLNPGDVVQVYDNDLCVGSDTLAESEALAYAVTAWGDDEITEAVDGATAGSLLSLALTKRASTTLLDPEGAFADNLTYAPDRLYKVTSVEFDTTTTRLLTELLDEATTLDARLDSLIAADSLIADSLGQVIAGQEVYIDQLEQENAAFQTQITELGTQIILLQDELTAANALLAAETARADSLQAVIDTFPDVAELEAENAALRQELADANAAIADVVAILSENNSKLARELCARLGC